MKKKEGKKKGKEGRKEERKEGRREGTKKGKKKEQAPVQVNSKYLILKKVKINFSPALGMGCT